MLCLEVSLLIVDARQMAAPLRHGYPTETITGTRLILVYGTRVPMVISANSSAAASRETETAPLHGMFCLGAGFGGR
jgi:hypothetical protein